MNDAQTKRVLGPIASDPEPPILSFALDYTVADGRLVIRAKVNPKHDASDLALLNLYDNRGSRVSSIRTSADLLASAHYSEIEVDVSDLAGGVYFYAFESEAGDFYDIVQFCVLGQSAARVGLLHPYFTWHAYCVEDGESFYQGKMFSTEKIIELSLERPLRGLSRCHDTCTLGNFSRMLSDNEIEHDNFCSAHLHTNPDILDKFDILIIAGHDEYWTHEQFDALEHFIRRGGHVANFSANVLCWAVELNDRRLFVDKRNVYEPGKSNARSSGQFRNPWVNRPQQRLFGLNYFYAGYPTKRISAQKALSVLTQEEYDASGNIEILLPNHDVFKGISVIDGVLDTVDDSLLDVEVDGVFLRGHAVDKLRITDVPENTKVLARALVNVAYTRLDKWGRRQTGLHFEKMGIICECVPYKDGGTTIQVGSVGWYKVAERPGSNEAKLTINILFYLMEKIDGK